MSECILIPLIDIQILGAILLAIGIATVYYLYNCDKSLSKLKESVLIITASIFITFGGIICAATFVAFVVQFIPCIQVV